MHMVCGKAFLQEVFLYALNCIGSVRYCSYNLAQLLGTDIACGNRAGVDTAFVLSGEGTLADLAKGQGKPTYIFENITEVCKAVFG